MGIFSDWNPTKIAAYAAAPLTFGTSVGLYEGANALNKKSNPSLPYRSGSPRTAADITLDSELAKTLGKQGAIPQANLDTAYGDIRTQFAADARGPGLRSSAPGGYFDTRLKKSQDLSNLGLTNSLASVLGDTGYKKFQSDNNYGQNIDLARLTGEINKPSTLEEVLGGLSGAAQAGGQIYGAVGGRKRVSSGTPYMPTSEPDYSRYTSGGSGLNLY